ncbi:hypothetical protein [Amycolatopsis anabasis]|uniref:hypothetical protein n=1 Tax=Amycolatopsis anabasis TaxID=1840409 RepID=UPI00131D0123|nr:hypothetical protein [Amycolatopsis anabasis]
MRYPAFRRGTFALVGGVLHEASYTGGDTVHLNSPQAENPDPELFSWNDEYAQWCGRIAADRCVRVYSVDVYAQYRGHSVLIENIGDTGLAGVRYAEWDPAWATGNGFIQQNRYEFRKKIPITELSGYYERQRDLLFDRWVERRFARRSPAPAPDDRPRSGILATVSGAEYPARYPVGGRIVLSVSGADNPDPALFSQGPDSRMWTAEVPVGRCARLAEVTTRAEYRGHPCQVDEIDSDGTVSLLHLGKAEKAAEDGFTHGADGRWTKSVPVFDLARYHEHHVDLLFDDWARGAGKL